MLTLYCSLLKSQLFQKRSFIRISAAVVQSVLKYRIFFTLVFTNFEKLFLQLTWEIKGVKMNLYANNNFENNLERRKVRNSDLKKASYKGVHTDTYSCCSHGHIHTDTYSCCQVTKRYIIKIDTGTSCKK